MTKNGERIKRFMEYDPHCHWCGREVFAHKVECGVRQPNDTATIDHLWDRHDMEKRKEAKALSLKLNKEYGIYLVLSCLRCNNKRNSDLEKYVYKTTNK